MRKRPTNIKRRGGHHKHTRHYVKVYAPYLPLVLSIVASVLLSFWRPTPGNTLAYATEMSHGALLAATNSHRANNGRAGLAINQQLNNAAQAKANDMVARNYWSHNTPDGKEPWVFVSNAGYKYTKAGENLAYGFSGSGETVVGWMNSASHKANMLDAGFSQVGFGYANSANFNGDGEQTVVVAMYAQPQTLAATTQPAPAAPAPAPKPKAATSAPAAPVTSPAPAPAATPEPIPAPAAETPVNTEQPVTETTPTPQQIAQVQTITGGRTPWAFAALSFGLSALIMFWLFHHSLRLRHLLHDTERLILHHPLLDATLLSFSILGLLLSRTVGVIL